MRDGICESAVKLLSYFSDALPLLTRNVNDANTQVSIVLGSNLNKLDRHVKM